MPTLNLEPIRPLQEQLNNHRIYGAIRDQSDLRVFKYLQQFIAPVQVPWIPNGDPSLRYFINHLVLEEESDTAPGPEGALQYGSHFELYCRAMEEIGADSALPWRFLARVTEQGIDAALYSDLVPLPARYFTETTFCFIREDKPHVVAAALAVGRERLIPGMFRQLADRVGIGADRAPAFHYYLNRHIRMDEDLHGPLSMSLLAALCGDDPQRIEEAETAAEEAVCARIRFWDGVLEAIEARRAG
jgi:Protein of unknown function (DUF3050)